MSETLSKVIERILLVIMCIIGSSLFFLLYQSTQKEIFAEELTRDYLESVTSSGCIETDDYVLYREALAGIDGFDTKLQYTTYHEEPVYGYYTKAEIDNFFAGRNKWDRYYNKTETPIPYDVDPSTLRMQRHTNATALARLLNSGLPIGDGVALGTNVYTAFEPVQEVYAGELLATVVEVYTGTESYYTEADMIPATLPASGVGDKTFNLSIGGSPIGASVSAFVWPRQVVCSNCSNTYTCTKQVVDHFRMYSTWAYCPYCRVLVRDITADMSTVTCPVGTKDTDITSVTFTVEYYDGTTEMFSLAELSHNYSSDYAGEQNITVSYKGFDKTGVCKIVTECPACVDCGLAITNRNAFDCSVYPKCSDCMAGVPAYLGTYAVVPETFSDDQISDLLITSGKFPMGRNDYLNLVVSHDGLRVKGKYSFLSSDKEIYFKMGQRVRRTGID